MENYCTWPHCCQLVEIEAEGTKVGKVALGCGEKEAELKEQVSAQPEEKFVPVMVTGLKIFRYPIPLALG